VLFVAAFHQKRPLLWQQGGVGLVNSDGGHLTHFRKFGIGAILTIRVIKKKSLTCGAICEIVNAMEEKTATFNGPDIYSAAITMTDRHDKRFADMLACDSKVGELERDYFVEEFGSLPVMGWQEFCRSMIDAGQTEWLDKIIKLDEEVLLTLMERRLLTSVEGGEIKKDLLDATVKALTGLVGRSKILSEQREVRNANTEVKVEIIGRRGNPTTGKSDGVGNS